MITASLGVSILVFTLALKATTALIGIPPEAWQWVSGGILIALGDRRRVPGPVGAVLRTAGAAGPLRPAARVGASA